MSYYLNDHPYYLANYGKIMTDTGPSEWGISMILLVVVEKLINLSLVVMVHVL